VIGWSARGAAKQVDWIDPFSVSLFEGCLYNPLYIGPHTEFSLYVHLFGKLNRNFAAQKKSWLANQRTNTMHFGFQHFDFRMNLKKSSP
jgi:hypothetical protein